MIFLNGMARFKKRCSTGVFLFPRVKVVEGETMIITSRMLKMFAAVVLLVALAYDFGFEYGVKKVLKKEMDRSYNQFVPEKGLRYRPDIKSLPAPVKRMPLKKKNKGSGKGGGVDRGLRTPKIAISKIVWLESKGNPFAKSRAGARGVCQIMPVVLKEYNRCNKASYKIVQLYNPKINIKIADWYLHKRLPQILRANRRPVTVNNLLISYNAGPSYVIKGKRPPRQTRRYVRDYRK